MGRLCLRLLPVLGYTLLFSFAQADHIEFQEEREYVIPGVEHINEALFNDIDFDGNPEVLARTSNHICLYSQTKDSILFETDIDTAGARKILFADINRDSIADIAVACFHDYKRHSDSALTIDLYDGAAGYQSTRQYFPNAERPPDNWIQYTDYSLTTFSALDVNQDGDGEMLVSYCNWIWNGGVGPPAHYWSELQYATSRLYHCYPDSQIWQRSEQFADPQMVEQSGVYFLMANKPAYWIYDGALTNTFSTSSVIRFDDECMEGYEYTSNFEASCKPDMNGRTHIHRVSELKLSCAGNIIPSDDTPEFVAMYRFLLYCQSGYPDSADTHGVHLRMYRMPEPDSAELVWVKEYANYVGYPGYKDLVFLPQYPGCFFAFTNDRLLQIDGSSGDELLSTQDLPAGQRRWDYPFGGNQPYLIATGGSGAKIYSVNLVIDSTDVDPPTALPTIFTMGAPYPNPFNAVQIIPVKITPGQRLTVDIYDLLGRKADHIFEGSSFADELKLEWNARAFSSGVYFIKAVSGNQTSVKKSVLLK